MHFAQNSSLLTKAVSWGPQTSHTKCVNTGSSTHQVSDDLQKNRMNAAERQFLDFRLARPFQHGHDFNNQLARNSALSWTRFKC